MKHPLTNEEAFLQPFQHPVIKFTELLLHFSALVSVVRHFISDWVVLYGAELQESFGHWASSCFYCRLAPSQGELHVELSFLLGNLGRQWVFLVQPWSAVES